MQSTITIDFTSEEIITALLQYAGYSNLRYKISNLNTTLVPVTLTFNAVKRSDNEIMQSQQAIAMQNYGSA